MPSKLRLQTRLLLGVALLALLGAIALLTHAYQSKQQDYQSNVLRMTSALESVAKSQLGSKGGIEKLPATVIHGKEYSPFPCIDVACPSVETVWYLLADKGQSEKIQKDIAASLEEQGNHTWQVNSDFGILGKDEQPYDAPSGKEWLNIAIWLSNKAQMP